MLKTAEFVSLGHPDRIADYISCYILDRCIEKDSGCHYAVEVMVKDNTVVLGGELSGSFSNVGFPFNDYVKEALREIGYDEKYASVWKENAIDISQLEIINKIGVQSVEINEGVVNNGWGDQGVFVGYACDNANLLNEELNLARDLNDYLFTFAKENEGYGLDIKTQVTRDEDSGVLKTVIVAIPLLDKSYQDKVVSMVENFFETKPEKIIVNGTGVYKSHSSIADCGITGRKLACDFYSTACPIGGGSPWTKDASKADLTLNLYARYLAIKNRGDNDECFAYLSSCIGKAELPSCTIQTVKNGVISKRDISVDSTPKGLIDLFGLNKPVFTKLYKKTLPIYALEVAQRA